MSKAPERCTYCDGQGNSRAGGECGFCEHGKPLDTQADWDASWGRIFDMSPEQRKATLRAIRARQSGEKGAVTESDD